MWLAPVQKPLKAHCAIYCCIPQQSSLLQADPSTYQSPSSPSSKACQWEAVSESAAEMSVFLPPSTTDNMTTCHWFLPITSFKKKSIQDTQAVYTLLN